jgi:hypothetical protein
LGKDFDHVDEVVAVPGLMAMVVPFVRVATGTLKTRRRSVAATAANGPWPA